MRKVYIIGAGMTRFGKYDGRHLPWKSLYELGGEACLMAMSEAGVEPGKIQAAYCGTVQGAANCGQTILDELGLCSPKGMTVYNHENACASSLTAFSQAWTDVGNGVYDLVMALGAEKMTALMGSGLGPVPKMLLGGSSGGEGGMGIVGGALQVPEGKMFLADVGMNFLAFFAMMTKRHMYEFGTTEEQLAMVSVKNHKHGAMNPYASYQREVTLEEVLNSPVLCDPVHLLEICPNTDGGSAVILASEDVARRYTTKPVEIRACDVSGALYKGKVYPNAIVSTVVTSKRAYEKAGVGPGDVDLVEMHDDSTSFEVFTYEDLGFCKKGEGGPFIEEGKSDYGGEVVFSPSGGLIAKGHPLGATGCGQLFEVFHQLRGECGARQVEGAKIGLIHNGGGIGGTLEPMVMCIAILAR